MAINELFGGGQRGCIVWVIAQKSGGLNKTMTVDTEDIGPIITHDATPPLDATPTIHAWFGSKIRRPDGQKRPVPRCGRPFILRAPNARRARKRQFREACASLRAGLTEADIARTREMAAAVGHPENAPVVSPLVSVANHRIPVVLLAIRSLLLRSPRMQKALLLQGFCWSEREDLNLRPLVSQTSALTGLRHAPMPFP